VRALVQTAVRRTLVLLFLCVFFGGQTKKNPVDFFAAGRGVIL
jgi:hypothetical protein